MSNHFGLTIPSTSFLEYAFLRWVLTPACNSSILEFVQAQKSVGVNNHNYKIDYVLEGSSLQLAIELDGFAYHGSRHAFSYDRLRQNDLQGAGYTVVRFSYDSVRTETKRCVEQLQTMMRGDPLLLNFVNPHPKILSPEMNSNALYALELPPHLKKSSNYFDLSRSYLKLEPLRTCQQEAFIAVGNYFANGGKRAACVMSVGAGKTALGVAVALAFTRKRVLIITPGTVIRGTFARALDAENRHNVLYHLPSGPLLPTCPPPNVLTLTNKTGSISKIDRSILLNTDIIVTNFHALGTGDSKGDLLSKLRADEIDLIIVDEAHIAAADSYQRAFRFFDKAKTLLMSACFERLDGKPIDADIVYRYKLVTSIADGHAKRLRVQRFKADPDASIYELRQDDKVDIIQGRDEILELLNDEHKLSLITAKSEQSIRKVLQLVKAALEHQRRELHPIKPRVLFSALGENHAAQLARLANEEGIITDYLHYGMGEARVRAVKERFEKAEGDLEAVVHLKMLGQGYDFPNISIVVPMRPYGSFGEFYQFIGRGIRIIRHPQLLQRKQFMDIILHSEMGLEDHLQSVINENRMNPHEESERENLEDIDEFIQTTLSPNWKQNDLQPHIEVLYEQGQAEQRVLQSISRVDIQKNTQEEALLAQRYATYVQTAQKPISFENYLKLFKKGTNG